VPQATEPQQKPAPWRQLYMAAILETDSEKLGHAIDAAQTAIDDRLREVGGNGEAQERGELYDACHGLSILRKERQGVA
jgi:hypothetical protein